MHLRGFFFMFLLISSWHSYAQQSPEIDSLKQLLEEEKDTLEQVKLLNTLASAYFYIAPQKAITYNEKAIQLIPKDNYYGLGNLYSTMGVIYGQLNEPPKTLSYLDSAAYFYTKAGNQAGLAFTYGNISNVYLLMAAYPKASEYIYKSIEINEDLGNTEGLAYNFIAMANIHFEQKEFAEAVKVGKKVLKEFSFPNEPILMGNISLNIGLAYSSMNSVDSALFYINQGLNYFKRKDYKGGMAYIYSEIALLYIKQHQLDSSKLYINKALHLEKYISNQKQKLELQGHLALIYFNEKKYSKSIALYNIVNETAHSIPNRQTERSALRGLIYAHKALKQYEQAANHIEQYIALTDTIFSAEKQRQIAELEIQYQTKKKEQEISLLEKDRDIQALKALRNQQWAYSACIILVLVVLISFLLLRQNKLQTTQQTTQLKHRLLRNQMNPHFIFNALTAIQSYVYENNPKEAGLYLSSFAKLVRAILENSRKEYITLEKEIQWLKNYLKLQLLRFDHQFEYEIDIAPEVDIYGLLLPPMLAQPFIENALEHGIKNIDYRGKLRISFSLDQEQHLKINIEDNGLGYENTTRTDKTKKHHSLATIITKERLSFLNKKQSKDINFTIKPKYPSGTIISFTIPLNYT